MLEILRKVGIYSTTADCKIKITSERDLYYHNRDIDIGIND